MYKGALFLLLLGGGLIIILAAFYFFTPAKTKPAASVSSIPMVTRTPAYTNPTDAPQLTVAPKDWTTYTHPVYGYSVRYPSAFRINERGKVGSYEDVIAIEHMNGPYRITIATLNVSAVKPGIFQKQAVVSGQDREGNFSMSSWNTLGNGKGVVIKGTVFPAMGNEYKYDEVLKEIIASFKQSP